ncbi:MAG: helix-turn-helix transcriptional regulator [Alphaproteobacteria bacterium]
MSHIARSAKDLGHILRQIRNSKNLTQAELASKTQTHQRLISRLETGNPGNTLKLIFKIFSIFDLEIEIRPRQKSSAQDIEDMFT